MKAIKNLVSALSDGEFHSTDELYKTLKCSESELQSSVKKLSTYGLKIITQKDKGYKLPYPVELLEQATLLKHLSTEAKARLDQVIIFDEIPSTNQYLLENIAKFKGKTIACLSEYQSHGRGRVPGRHWVTPFASQICLTLLWHYSGDIQQLRGLSSLIGIAVMRALNEYGINTMLGLKWPNDIYYNGAKLGGILIDIKSSKDAGNAFIIGLGLNLYPIDSQSNNIGQETTNLYDLLGKVPMRNRLIALLVSNIFKMLDAAIKHNFSFFIQEWLRYDVVYNRPVRVLMLDKVKEGIARGVNEQGELLVEYSQGVVEPVMSGEVSVRLNEK